MKNLLALLTLLTPLTTTAAESNIYDFCINIMPEITRTSGLQNLDLIPDGYNLSKVDGVPSINCMYSAIASGPKGPAAVIGFAKLNLSNNKLTFEIE